MSGQIRYACEWTASGIGVAAQRCVGALAKAQTQGVLDAALAWEPLMAEQNGRSRALQSGDAASWLRALRRPRQAGEVLVHHSVPGEWKSVAAALQPSHQIGHSVWELDDVPMIWKQQMSDVDEFWVPTEWNREAFERAFQRPVHVVPHIVSDIEPGRDPMGIPDDVAVVSLVSAWDWRKRPDRAIEAFCHAFTAADGVALAVKTTPWHVAWPGGISDVPQLIHRITEMFPDPPIVYYDMSIWTDAQMLGLAQRSACTLSLTASEGWGLGTFDAAALGVPAIITGYGGQVDYLGEDYPGLLPYRRVKTTHLDRDLFEPGTEWAFADLDVAVDMLRSVVGGSASELTRRAATLAPELRRRYSSDVVGKQMATLLGESLATVAGGAAVGGSRTKASDVHAPKVVAAGGGDDDDDDEVVILTPVKNAAHHAAGFVDRILSLSYPTVRVAVLVSDSTDGTTEAFRSEFRRLTERGIDAEVFEKDFGYSIPEGVQRWEPSIQLERRLVLARSRNHLLSRALSDAAWALWIDVDVVDFPFDVIEQLLAVDVDVVQPHCLGSSGTTFDLNAWTDQGRYHFDDYVGHRLIELHAVGGTMLLVRADCHRDGLTWPAYLHGGSNDRIRTDLASLGREEIGEVETEGLGVLAYDMGIAGWGLPELIIRHE
jgi:glycosyltransferase involved in cell wall biosynthesis